jgi:hypothetical protein
MQAITSHAPSEMRGILRHKPNMLPSHINHTRPKSDFFETDFEDGSDDDEYYDEPAFGKASFESVSRTFCHILPWSITDTTTE